MVLSGKVFHMVTCRSNKHEVKVWGQNRIFFITILTFGVISVHLRTDLYFLWRFDLPTATELSISQHTDFSHTHWLTHSSCLPKHTHTHTSRTGIEYKLQCDTHSGLRELSLLTSHNSQPGSKLSKCCSGTCKKHIQLHTGIARCTTNSHKGQTNTN